MGLIEERKYVDDQFEDSKEVVNEADIKEKGLKFDEYAMETDIE